MNKKPDFEVTSVSAVAKYLQCTRSKVQRLLDQGIIEASYEVTGPDGQSRRSYKISLNSVQDYLEKNK